MGRKLEDLEEYVSEAINNIRSDRAITSALLVDLFQEIKSSGDIETHKSLGLVAAKYVETLQRSNEQLVKITAVLNKKKDISDSFDALGEEDKKELFNIIQEAQE